ncbi:MAG: hypothetical protein JNM99_11985 [Verrucomicrobiaceae bacterium]|nr:hypothetical protein [Verrucomicrobiaceae bacterium]
MIAQRQRSSWKFIAVVALLATVLGGAFVGYRADQARRAERAAAFRAAKEAQDARERDLNAKAVPLSDHDKDDDESKDEDEDDEGWSFHDRLKKFFAEGDDSALDGLKPKGITEIEGAGGKGLNRQVKSHGIWYPVFDLSKAKKDGSGDVTDPDKVELNKVPLSIVSPNPTAGIVGQTFSYAFIAVGGSPPYRWAMQLGSAADRFVLDPNSGVLTGSATQPVSTSMNVFVTDTEGQQASAAFSLVISPTAPLTITTSTLPVLEIGKLYQATLAGEGGVPPYTWTIATTVPLQCDPSSGVISGTATEAGEFTVNVTLTDSQQTAVDKVLNLSVSAGLEIVTESPLLPAAPGSNYTTTFESRGGTPPYQWRVAGGSLPDGWSLSADGILSGLASTKEGLFHFGVEVRDANALIYQKTFDLAVIQPLTVVPSRQRAGIAWQPTMMARVLPVPIATVIVNRSGPGGVREMYRGSGSNFVDHGLVTGGTYDYQLTANTVDGKSVVFGKRQVTILPFGLSRAAPGATADPFADAVRSFNPLNPGGYGAAALPSNVTGPPDGRSTFTPAYLPTQLVSLHAFKSAGGSITLEFTDNIIELGPGADFTVFENVMFQNGDPNQRFMEPAVVEVALFEGQWFRFPINVNPPVKGEPALTNPSYYAQGFAGVNATTGDDPTNAARSGGDSFDVNALGMSGITWVRFVRLISPGDRGMADSSGNVVRHTTVQGALSGSGSSGFDLDAVSAVNY